MSLRVLLVDNYDSFTYNLAHALEVAGAEVRVERNDAVTAAWVAAAGFDAVVLSPGPGRPEDAGVSVEIVRTLPQATPLLGVCLGHQAIAYAHGGRIVPAPTLVHGKTSEVRHDGSSLYEGLPNPFEATRYHSLTVEPSSVPEELVVAARTGDGVIMGLRHRSRPLEGVQFHPESILTVHGSRLIGNFVSSRLPVSPARRADRG